MCDFYIYEITKIDGDIKYIGQRKCPKNKTPETDDYMGSSNSIFFNKSMYKNNPEKFGKRIIVSGLTQEQADRIEIELISLSRYVPEDDNKYPLFRKYFNYHPGGIMGNIRESKDAI